MEKLIFKSKISDLFQLGFILTLCIVFSMLLIFSDYYYVGIIFIIFLVYLVILKSKQILVYNTYVVVSYFFLKNRTQLIEFTDITRVEVISAIFMTPNLSMVLKNKKRINFEFGNKKEFTNLLNLFKLNGIRIVDQQLPR